MSRRIGAQYFEMGPVIKLKVKEEEEEMSVNEQDEIAEIPELPELPLPGDN